LNVSVQFVHEIYMIFGHGEELDQFYARSTQACQDRA
jgi:hypothetical protein